MPMGRPPRPSKLKQLLGTARADRANPVEPIPASHRPRCPKQLGPQARRIFREAVKLLDNMGLAAEIDGMALAAFAFHGGNFLQAAEEVKKTGLCVQGARPRTVIISPFLTIANMAAKQVRVFAGEFGMTPAARVRLVVPPGAGADAAADAEFDAYLRGERRAPGAEAEDDDEVLQ